jgi:hypothetical protein
LQTLLSFLLGAKVGASCVNFLLWLARVRGHRDDSIYYDHRVGTSCLDPRQHKACSGRWRGVYIARVLAGWVAAPSQGERSEPDRGEGQAPGAA